MNECDIYVAEEILKRLKNRNGCVTGVDIEELVTDEAQYYRICCSLCNFGAAIKGSIGLSGTEKTAYIISNIRTRARKYKCYCTTKRGFRIIGC